jgi:uncharacterized protein YjdB
MKKIISLSLIVIILSAMFLYGCGKVDVEKVTISDKEVTLQLKDSYNLSATVSPDDSAEPMIYWESSDTSVVTVKSGVVTAVGEGEATVKAFTKNGKYDQCTCKVENILTEKLTLNKKDFTMMLGATQTIQYTIVPENVTDNAIDWESSDVKIAVVDNGKVTAKGVGTCEITAETSNGIKAKCKVTVKVKPKGIRLNANMATVATGKTLAMSATVLPANTAYKEVTWESSDEDVATVDSKGVVTGVSAGSCKIYATTYNNKYDYCKLTVTQDELTYKGKGNKTLKNVTVTEGIYAITLTHKGKGVFKVIGSDGEGNAYTYVSTTGEYKGTNLYANGKNDGVKKATITVAATGDWTIKIKAISYDGTDNISGEGECVTKMFKGTNEKDDVSLKNTGNGDFTVFLFDNTGKQIAVMCDEIDDFDGTVKATLDKNKYYFLVVKSSGKWSVDFNNGSKKSTVSSTN